MKEKKLKKIKAEKKSKGDRSNRARVRAKKICFSFN